MRKRDGSLERLLDGNATEADLAAGVSSGGRGKWRVAPFSGRA
jgi:hypothetical protein